MNAIDLLTADHEAVEALFQEVEASDESEHPAIFEQIKNALEAHAHLEETIFYPSLQEEGSDELIELTSEAIQEHMQMKNSLGELSVSAADPTKFEPLLEKLIEDVRHHVEEEEGEIFPMVEDEFDTATIEEWGEQMQLEKDRFQSSAESAHA
jgi:hemerythrin superfamily protein